MEFFVWVSVCGVMESVVKMRGDAGEGGGTRTRTRIERGLIGERMMCEMKGNSIIMLVKCWLL